MGKNIPLIYTSNSLEQLTATINTMRRIGEAEKDKWEPFYHAAFGSMRLIEFANDSGEKDKYLDQAMELVKRGISVSEGNAELESLRGYVIMMQLTVDPAVRGQQYSGMAFNAFNKAVSLDPTNPRALFLLGQMQLGTAQFFGGGDGGSCETFRKALVLFDEYKNDNPFAPDWGKSGVQQVLLDCND